MFASSSPPSPLLLDAIYTRNPLYHLINIIIYPHRLLFGTFSLYHQRRPPFPSLPYPATTNQRFRPLNNPRERQKEIIIGYSYHTGYTGVTTIIIINITYSFTGCIGISAGSNCTSSPHHNVLASPGKERPTHCWLTTFILGVWELDSLGFSIIVEQ